MRATAAAQPDVVALLLNRGASVQLRDAAGRRASEVVTRTADRKRLLALLAPDPVEARAAGILAARDDADGVRALLTRGADVNERSRCQTREAYHPAALDAFDRGVRLRREAAARGWYRN